LKGIGNVKVIGRVSVEWGQFLKESLESETRSAEIFEHKTPVQWEPREMKRKRKGGNMSRKGNKRRKDAPE